MTEKLKKDTNQQLIMRSGGFALSLPIVIVLGAILMIVNSLMAVIIIGGLLTGDSTVAPYLSWLSIFLVLGVATMVVMFRAVFRYTGGIGKLWKRRQGIQDEKVRVERLIGKQDNEINVDNQVLNYSQNDENEQQQ